MKRSSNPFDLFGAEDTFSGSKNNPFLKDTPTHLATSSSHSLELRLARLKLEMQEYEHRMSISWQPPAPSRQAEITKMQAELERKRKQLRSGDFRSPPSLPRASQNPSASDRLEVLEGEYLQRLHYMRNSLETKKREITSALGGTGRHVRGATNSEVRLPWKVGVVGDLGMLGGDTATDLEFKLRTSEVSLPDKDTEIAVLRSEQSKLKEEMSELRLRLSELERRSTVQPFALAEPEATTVMRELKWKDTGDISAFARPQRGYSHRFPSLSHLAD